MIENIFKKETKETYIFNDIIGEINMHSKIEEISNFLKKYFNLNEAIFKSEIPLEISDSTNKNKSKYFLEAYKVPKSKLILFFEYFADFKYPNHFHHLALHVSSKSKRNKKIIEEALHLAGYL